MFFLKACPKCHGDLYLERDGYGAYIERLQCGLLRDLVAQLIGMAERPIGFSNQLPFSLNSIGLSA